MLKLGNQLVFSVSLAMDEWEGFEIFMLKEYASIVIYGSFLKL